MSEEDRPDSGEEQEEENVKPLPLDGSGESLRSYSLSSPAQGSCTFQVSYSSLTDGKHHEGFPGSSSFKQKAPFWYSSSGSSDTSPLFCELRLSAEPPPCHKRRPSPPAGCGQRDSCKKASLRSFFPRSFSVAQRLNAELPDSGVSTLPRALSPKRGGAFPGEVGRSPVYVHCETQQCREETYCTAHSSERRPSACRLLSSHTESQSWPSSSCGVPESSASHPGTLTPTQSQEYIHPNASVVVSSVSCFCTRFRGVCVGCCLPILVVLSFTVHMAVCLFTRLFSVLRKLLLLYHPRSYRGGKFARAFEALEVWILAALVGVLTAYSAFYIHHTSNFIGDLRFGICRRFYWLDRR